jgi:hypothetical protein
MASNAQEQDRGTAQQAKHKAQEVAHAAEQKVEEVSAQARQAAGEARQRASEIGQQAQQKVAEAADQVGQSAQQAASALGHQAAEAAQAQVERRKHQLAEGVNTFGQALRLGAKELRQQGHTQNTQYVERLAGQVESLSTSLERMNTRQTMTEVERFARQNQALFLGGAFALGVLGARFLKSSSTPEHLQEVEEGWSTRELTDRVDEPEHDAIGRPGAPGYEPPRERATSATDSKAAGPRTA